MPHTEAQRIFQEWLDAGGRAIMDGDFDRFADMVTYPCVLATAKMRETIRTRDDLRVGFDAFAAALRGHKATHLVRLAFDVARVAEDEIAGFYTTGIVAGSTLAIPSYTSSMRLLRDGGAWKCTEVTSGLGNRQFPFSVLQPARRA